VQTPRYFSVGTPMGGAATWRARMTELIGWMAATVLLATMGRQVYSQWRDGTSQGVSKWLFIGQLTASSGFVMYSWQLGNWVFVATNLLMLLTAGIGQWIFLSNKKGVGV
jgi:uncharacterized protein with PQ loop repeat